MIRIRMLVLLVVSLPQVKLGPDATYMLPISRSGTSRDARRGENAEHSELEAEDRGRRRERQKQRRTSMRTSASVGGAAVPISRDNLSDEVGEYDDDMLRPW